MFFILASVLVGFLMELLGGENAQEVLIFMSFRH
jgi:hypothetical protein